MAKARICDRCGQFFTSENQGKVDGYNVDCYNIRFYAAYADGVDIRHSRAYPNISPAELCKDCAREFLEWFIEGVDEKLVVSERDGKTNKGLLFVTKEEDV